MAFELTDKDRLDLAKMGFKTPTASDLIRMLVSVEAGQKSGKTHWALGAPEPVAYFNFDTGLEGVIDKFLDRDIQLFPFPPIATLGTVDEAAAQLEKFLAAYVRVLGVCKTIVIDTASEAWELYRLARLGKLSGVKAHHYGQVNMEFRRMIRQAYDTPGQNLILVHKVKPVYSGDQRTSQTEKAGFGDVGYDIQVNVGLELLVEDGELTPTMTIIDCRHKPQLAGREFSGDLCCWDVLQNLVIGG